MLPYRVYQPQELEALSPLTPLTMAGHRPASKDEGTDAGPTANGGLRTMTAVLARLIGRGRVRRPAPGTI
ncbi:MAG TPA: hypothetical protein VFE55_05975 [Acidimicrobiia bacterium]|nr:hypothetical protein [Acidimicrobiia bacterium]